MSNGRLPNDEDFFAHTRMSLGDHIEELRGCLWRAVKWFFLAMVIGIFLAKYALDFIAAPIEQELMVFYKERFDKKIAALESGDQKLTEANAPREVRLELPPDAVAALARRMGQPAPPASEEDFPLLVHIRPAELLKATDEAARIFTKPPLLRALTILEAIIVWIKMAMYLGLVIAAPLVFREVWSFVAAGLYPQEKALVWRALPLSIGLFLAGVVLFQFVLLPIAIHYLLGFNAWLDIEPELRLTDWLSFAIFTPLVFGIAFQTPLVMFVLDRVGILSVQLYIDYWRIATFVIILLSGFLAPSPDPVSMLALGLPIVGLYWLGIGMCIWWPRPKVDLDVTEEEQQNVEV